MPDPKLQFEEIDGRYSVCRLSPEASFPAWVNDSTFLSVTRTDKELSIVTSTDAVPHSVRAEHNWVGFCISGTLDFSETGILAEIAEILAGADIPVFVVSTFDTDYLFVRDHFIVKAREHLRGAGHAFLEPQP